MTILGPDISSYEHGLDLSRLPFPFVLMKCTENTGYVDADYAGWLAQARATGKIPVAYHFIGPAPAAAQAAHLAAHILDRSVPVMVDFEDEGSFHPTLAQLLALNDAVDAVGLRVVLNYLPHWMWEEIGSPSLTPIADRGIGLVSSSYPGGQGYPGDGAPGWNRYGNLVPVLYQYTDKADVDGQHVGDMNAYRGTIEQFSALINPLAPTPTGLDVNLNDILGPISPGLAALTPDASAESLGAGATFSVGAALTGLTVRETENLILTKRIWAVVSRGTDAAGIAAAVVAALVPHIPPAVDSSTVASAVVAAMEAHVPGVIDVDALSETVISHFAARLSNG